MPAVRFVLAMLNSKVTSQASRWLTANTMISVHEALRIIAEETSALGTERVSLHDAPRRILAEEIHADMDLPPFDRSQMDGYAVRAEDVQTVPVKLRIVGEAAAGGGWRGTLGKGEAVRIMTGAPVPAGADSVQQLEVARETEDSSHVRLERATQLGQNIVKRAREVSTGATVFEAGAEITSGMVATLASFGYGQVGVGVRPRLAVIATGAELVAVEARPAEDQIRDSNSHTLAAYGRLAGAEITRYMLVGDELSDIERAVSDASQNADMVVLSGGVSVGAYDYTKAALKSLGAELFFERVRLRPGKPTVFGRLGSTLVFGLPGNPVSSAVTFNLFARAALRIMQGARQPTLLEEHAALGSSVKRLPERTSYLPAALRTTENGICTADALKWGGSSDFIAFAHAAALVIIPEGTDMVETGTIVRIVRLPIG